MKRVTLAILTLLMVTIMGLSNAAWADDDNQNNNDNNNQNNTNNSLDSDGIHQFFDKSKYQYLKEYSPHKTFSLDQQSGG